MSQGANELQEFEMVFKALAHPTRRHILVILQSRGGEVAGSIVKRFPDKWPTISRHLHQLQEAGLIKVERKGRELIYKIDNVKMKAVLNNWLQWF